METENRLTQEHEQAYQIVQEIIFPNDKSAIDLYLRILNGYVEIDENGLILKRAAKISFNTFFNSFYHNYWNNLTEINSFFIELTFTGSIKIEIFRDTNREYCHFVHWKELESKQEKTEIIQLPLNLTSNNEGDRTFFDILAKKKSSIRSIAIKTAESCKRIPKCVLEFHAHNDELSINKHCAAILNDQQLVPFIDSITILDGDRCIRTLPGAATVASPAMASRPADEGEQPIQPKRVATGAGAADQPITHRIALQDAAHVDVHVLRNLIHLLHFLADDVTIDGHILDIAKPWMLYDFAPTAKMSARHTTIPDSIDLREINALVDFYQCTPSQTPFWSLRVMPVEPLPNAATIPVATRTGRQEADRIAESAAKTVVMPGFAVWRETPEYNLESFPLQELIFQAESNISELFLRKLDGAIEVDEHYLTLEAGAKVSFNTYFNSFYESYWTECTTIDELSLLVEFSGTVRVEIFRDTKTQGISIILNESLTSGGFGKKTCELDLANKVELGEAGRLFVDVTAASKTKIRKITLQTTTPPNPDLSLTLGICTYNRESFLHRNLQAITREQQALPFLAKIIVVNQGKPFQHKELVALVEQEERIAVVEQRNLGGCGGFTRSMHEALNYPGVTHHVLMDDDAVVDPRILHNLGRFLGYVRPNIVVGGPMLDLLRPWILYEAGAIVRPNSRIKLLHHNIDLRTLESLAIFTQCHYSDYNAWWFCALPTAKIREAQFPAPIFIRGDDMEYGVRLQELGVKTVTLPGIGVWHEPFYVKVGSWQIYYDLRNRLILASVYPHRFSLESPKDVLWWMMQALALHDYSTARLLCKAVEDFLKGPRLFATDAAAIHEEVAQIVKRFGPEAIESTDGMPKPRLRPMPDSEVSIGFLVAGRITAHLFARKAHKVKPRLLLDHEANIATVKSFPYVKTNSLGSYRILYRPNRKELRRLLFTCFRLFHLYRQERTRAAAAWREDIGRLRSGSHWSAIFKGETGLEGSEPPPPPDGAASDLAQQPASSLQPTETEEKRS